MRIAVALQAGRNRSLPFSAETLVNLYAEVPAGPARGPVVLHGTPGLAPFATGLGAGPVRGLHVMDGVLYAVSGTALYAVGADGTATALGAVTGGGPVSLASNAAGQLCIVAAPSAYVYTAAGGLAPIADADLGRVGSVARLNSYGLFAAEDSDEIRPSDLDDFTTLDPLDVFSAEADPDPLVRIFPDGDEALAFGRTTTEVFRDTGAADVPIQRLEGARIRRGLIAPFAVCGDDNTVFFVGDDRVVYRLAGYVPERVSTHEVETALERLDALRLRDLTMFAHTVAGHKFVCLNTADGALCLDVATGLWAERRSYGMARWRASTAVEAYGRTLVGDAEAGAVHALDGAVFTDAGRPLRRVAVTPPLTAEGRRLSMARLELELEAGVGLTTGQGADPQVMMQYSDDGGRTWSNELWRGLGARGAGRTRVEWRRLGSFFQRTIRFVVSDPVPVAIYGAFADVE